METYSLNLVPKPKHVRDFCIKVQLIVSNAFTKSRKASKPDEVVFST